MLICPGAPTDQTANALIQSIAHDGPVVRKGGIAEFAGNNKVKAAAHKSVTKQQIGGQVNIILRSDSKEGREQRDAFLGAKSVKLESVSDNPPKSNPSIISPRRLFCEPALSQSTAASKSGTL